MKCPECQFDNPADSKFCKECRTRLPSPEDISVSRTKTIGIPVAKGSTVAGKYRILEKLGEGGMGVVYKAKDIKLKREVALKFLPPELTHDPETKERFIREAQAAASLDHPNICTVHEIDEAEGKTFISMAYVEGQRLREKIESGPLKTDEALNIAIQAADGLEEAHKKGIIHRDIKSSNIMVTGKGQAKIMDFGLAKRYTENTEAYKLYLRAVSSMLKATEEGLQKSFDYLNQALEEDPTYALAYSGLAGLYSMLGYYKYLPPQDAYPRAKVAAEKALELDDNLAEAHETMSMVKLFYEWDWTGAEEEIKRAIELNPNLEDAHAAYSLYYNLMGRHKDAIDKISRALELNPISEWMNVYYGFMLLLARQYDQAIEHNQKSLKIFPNNFIFHMNLGWNYSLKGMYEEAIRETEKAVELSGNNPMTVGSLGRVLAVAGRREEAKKILDEMLEQSKKKEIYVSPYYVGIIYLKLGQKDKAFEWFEKAYEIRDDMIVHLKADPDFDPISSDPKFRALLKKMNLD